VIKLSVAFLSILHRILTNILLSRLNPYADDMTGDHQCGFRRNKSKNYEIFYIRQVQEKNGSIMAQYIGYLYISRKPTVQLGRKCYTIFSLSSEYPGKKLG
jgi:hypothetical protein